MKIKTIRLRGEIWCIRCRWCRKMSKMCKGSLQSWRRIFSRSSRRRLWVLRKLSDWIDKISGCRDKYQGLLICCRCSVERLVICRRIIRVSLRMRDSYRIVLRIWIWAEVEVVVIIALQKIRHHQFHKFFLWSRVSSLKCLFIGQ